MKLLPTDQQSEQTTSLGNSNEPLTSGTFGFFENRLKFIKFESETEKQRFQCVQCKETLRPPVKQTQCGHRLCSICLDEIRNSDGDTVCPGGESDCMSLKSAENFFPDKVVFREMQKLFVRCRNTLCDAKVRMENVCEHEENCQYEVTACPNSAFDCKARFPKFELQEHLRICRIGICKHCENDILEVQRENHESNCLRTPVFCQFNAIGCKTQDVPPKLQNHSKDDVQNHLQLVMNKLLSVEKDLKDATDHVFNPPNSATKEEILKSVNSKLQGLSSGYKHAMTTIANCYEITLLNKEETKEEIETLKSRLEKVLEMNKQQEERLKSYAKTAKTANQQNNSEPQEKNDFLIAMQIQFKEIEGRFDCLETVSYNGTLIWQIINYRQRKQEAREQKVLSLYSQPFYTDQFGYKMCLRVYLNGDGMGRGSHVSVYFVVMKGKYDALLRWPFGQRVQLLLLAQETGKTHLSDIFQPDPESTSFKKPLTEMNIGSGCPLFVAQTVLENKTYLRDDCVYFKAVVTPTK